MLSPLYDKHLALSAAYKDIYTRKTIVEGSKKIGLYKEKDKDEFFQALKLEKGRKKYFLPPQLSEDIIQHDRIILTAISDEQREIRNHINKLLLFGFEFLGLPSSDTQFVFVKRPESKDINDFRLEGSKDTPQIELEAEIHEFHRRLKLAAFKRKSPQEEMKWFQLERNIPNLQAIKGIEDLMTQIRSYFEAKKSIFFQQTDKLLETYR